MIAAKASLLAILSVSCAFLVESRRTYRAAVVNYVPYRTKGAEHTEIIQENTSKFSYYIEECTKCDIIIFPEYGLVSKDLDLIYARDYAFRIPEAPRAGICRSDGSDFIARMSCISQQFRRYVVVNLLENDDGNLYNTNIVFDRNGTLISKYRKEHLSEEERRSLKPGSNARNTFETDFGATFSLFIGEDILYETNAGLSPNVILTTSMKTRFPLLGSLSIFDGFSKKHGVNLLVADYNDLPIQDGASGFYLPSNATRSTITSALQTSKPLEAVIETNPENVPDICSREETVVTGILAYKPNDVSSADGIQEDFNKYRLQPLRSGANELKLVSNDGKLLCEFNVDLELSAGTTYVAAAYSDGESEVYGCAVLVCERSDLNTCGGRVLNSKTVTINSIEIRANGRNVQHAKYNIPITFTYDLKPIGQYTYCTSSEGIVMQSKSSISGILAYGFFGREPIGKNDPKNPNSAQSVASAVALILSALLFTAYY